jgi:hypothetical protein
MAMAVVLLTRNEARLIEFHVGKLLPYLVPPNQANLIHSTSPFAKSEADHWQCCH